MRPTSYYVINAITLYRLVAAPVLVIIVLMGMEELFGWLLAVSFFTDLIDGTLARKFKVTSVFGSRLDSVADDLTILAGVAGLFVLKMEFLKTNKVIVIGLIVLMVAQNLFALYRYGKLSSFHTYAAKTAAILQGCFLILMFLLPEPLYPLFYAAALVSAIDLVEELIIVALLREWKTDVKGLYWVLRTRRNASRSDG